MRVSAFERCPWERVGQLLDWRQSGGAWHTGCRLPTAGSGRPRPASTWTPGGERPAAISPFFPRHATNPGPNPPPHNPFPDLTPNPNPLPKLKPNPNQEGAQSTPASLSTRFVPCVHSRLGCPACCILPQGLRLTHLDVHEAANANNGADIHPHTRAKTHE